MKKIVTILAILNIVLSALLFVVLNTDYQYTFCNEKNECFTSKQKIIDYILEKN